MNAAANTTPATFIRWKAMSLNGKRSSVCGKYEIFRKSQGGYSLYGPDQYGERTGLAVTRTLRECLDAASWHVFCGRVRPPL